MATFTTYRNDRDYGFCPGCGHRLILDALDRALVRLQWDPAAVVIVSDIGCVGLSDQYFRTSAFHGLHGRSLTYATGVKLARPDLHVINLIGDGGCGIGCAHLVNAARRNIGVNTLVFNNLNFGMTGGEHSVTTPTDRVTTTTPWGNPERPLDIAQTVAANGATFVWRGTAFAPDLDGIIASALAHDGFALLDIWELCVAYYAAANRVTPKALRDTINGYGFTTGHLPTQARPEGTAALHDAWRDHRGDPVHLANSIAPRFLSTLDRPHCVLIAGAAGMHVRTAGHLLGTAATLSGLWSTQRDDYPVTVRSGHSLSTLILSPEPVHYTGATAPDLLIVLAAEGWAKVAPIARAMAPDATVVTISDLAGVVETSARRLILQPEALAGVPKAGRALAITAAAAAYLDLISDQALLTAAADLNPTYAQANQSAVQAALTNTTTLLLQSP